VRELASSLSPIREAEVLWRLDSEKRPGLLVVWGPESLRAGVKVKGVAVQWQPGR
jgi:hypothetical protein